MAFKVSLDKMSFVATANVRVSCQSVCLCVVHCTQGFLHEQCSKALNSDALVLLRKLNAGQRRAMRVSARDEATHLSID